MEWAEVKVQALEWVQLGLRWFHVVAGVTWIGQTFLFHWMEQNLVAPDPKDGSKENIAGDLWMVHGGGFYLVEKQKKPAAMPKVLHWFKYEALLTWISGILLLTLVFYYGGQMSGTVSTLVGIGTLILGFIAYDLACISPLGKNRIVFAAVAFVALIGLIYLLHAFMPTRAAYFHIGALFGTIMVANVWLRILPGQQKMIDAVLAHKEPDMSYGVQGKLRSRHNSYMSIPLIFIMISQHYSTTTYGHTHGKLILAGLILAGWAFAYGFLFIKRKPPAALAES